MAVAVAVYECSNCVDRVIAGSCLRRRASTGARLRRSIVGAAVG
jgi:hypothetical protein